MAQGTPGTICPGSETTADRTTAVQLLLQHLEGEGVRHIFGVPGGPLMPLYEAMFERGTIRPILAKHEQGAAFMADGYARVRRGLGVCCATTGPGGTNALTGIACAAADSIPVLLVTAQVATFVFGKGAAQESTTFSIDLVDLFKPATKASLMLVNPERMGETARYCLRQALSGRPGPVHLNIPADLMKRRVAADHARPERYRAPSRCFDRASTKEAARRLVHARHPAMLLGHGVNISGAFQAARLLAERLDIPTATTPKAKGALPEDHPLSLGVFGFAGSPLAEAYLLSGNVDVLLAVGTGLGEQSSQGWNQDLTPSGCLIQVDADPHEIGTNYPVHVPAVGDADAVLTEIRFEAERLLRWLEPPARRDGGRSFAEIKAKQPRFLRPETLTSDSFPLKPQRVVREMEESLPQNPILFCDIGNSMTWMLHYLTVREPGAFHVNLGLASMGHAVAAAIGGQLAAPERTVVSVVGDAAFAMNGMEVHTAVEYNIPVIWLVLNNGGHGMVHYGEQRQFRGKFSTAKFSRPLDVAAMAEAMGARALRVWRPGDLSRLMPEVLRMRRPTVIDARVDIETAPPMDSRIKSLDRFFNPPADDLRVAASAP